MCDLFTYHERIVALLYLDVVKRRGLFDPAGHMFILNSPSLPEKEGAPGTFAGAHPVQLQVALEVSVNLIEQQCPPMFFDHPKQGGRPDTGG
jgi:hypothetical protein